MNTKITNRIFNPSEPFNQPSIPYYEVKTIESGYRISVELPGLVKDQVHIETKERSLHIWTALSKTDESQNVTYRLQEFKTSEYDLKLRLNNRINPNEITAVFKNGILELNLPLAEEAKPRSITIN